MIRAVKLTKVLLVVKRGKRKAELTLELPIDSVEEIAHIGEASRQKDLFLVDESCVARSPGAD